MCLQFCLYYVNIFLDIDECVQGPDICDVNADCTDTDGSFMCQCRAGYSGDGVTCSGEFYRKDTVDDLKY